MKIKITAGSFGSFVCVDDDCYDGAPDAEGESSISGHGNTEYEAFMDWAEMFASTSKIFNQGGAT